jgi:signal transduction histidine kinase
MTVLRISLAASCATMEAMKRTPIEPGLLQVFRIFVGIRVFLALVGFRLQARVPAQQARLFLLLVLIEAAILLIYLTWPWLRKSLGIVYLPFALIYASISPILEQALGMILRQAGILRGDTATAGVWWLTLLLLIPMIIVSWQYSFKALVAYTGGTAAVELTVIIPIGLGFGIDVSIAFWAMVIRSLLFLLIGSIIVRMMRAQREQRKSLAEANVELARHATTIEQLATSRERNRLARELHDTLAHTLSGLAVQLEAMNSIWSEKPQITREMLEKSLETTRNGLQEARRAIQALRASALEDLGLSLALRNLAESAAVRAGVKLELQLPDRLDNIDPAIEQSVYRIAEQAIANAAQHAIASRLTVQLIRENGRLTLIVADDGRGFDV